MHTQTSTNQTRIFTSTKIVELKTNPFTGQAKPSYRNKVLWKTQEIGWNDSLSYKMKLAAIIATDTRKGKLWTSH